MNNSELHFFRGCQGCNIYVQYDDSQEKTDICKITEDIPV